MTWFLFKGLLRDRHRSLFPVIIVAAGVILTVIAHAWVSGLGTDVVASTAKMDSGHVKIITRGYYELSSQLPNDLALMGSAEMLELLAEDYPEMNWAPRIKFGGLLDVPDENGETKNQGPAFGIGLDLLSASSLEIERFNLKDALIRGRMPEKAGEILLSEKLAQTLEVNPGDTATFIGSATTGSMAIHNFIVAGTVTFGMTVLDKNAFLADISDVQYALDMENATGEILGFFKDDIFNSAEADSLARKFNKTVQGQPGDFAPMMLTLRDQNGMGQMLDLINMEVFIIIGGLIFVMSIVLWNTGLMSGIRRYGEIGLRLAMGEAKGHLYRTLIIESILIGLLGSLLGTAIGLGLAYWLQVKGFDAGSMMKGSTLMISNIMRAQITPVTIFIGFIPGLAATVLGSLIAGIGIFKRQTAQLFKELET